MESILIVTSLVLAYLRVIGHKSLIFQAVAHLFVGGIFVSWFCTGNKLHLGLGIGLSLIELACFIYFKYQDYFNGLIGIEG